MLGNRSFGSVLSFVVLVGLLVGCGRIESSSHEDPILAEAGQADETAGMLQSELVTAKGPSYERAVVGIQLLDIRGKVITFCSATLIRSDVVLTGAHCFDDALITGVRARRVRDARFLNETGPVEAGSRMIINRAIHPLYNSLKRKSPPGVLCPTCSTYDHDVALVFLDQPMRRSIPLQELASSEERLYPGQVLTSYGFGLSADWGPNAKQNNGKYYQKLQRGTLVVSDQHVMWDGVPEDRVYTRMDSESNICQGDSGGPAYSISKITGKPTIMALNSCGGMVSFHEDGREAERTCKGQGILQPIAPVRDWIDKTLKQNGR